MFQTCQYLIVGAGITGLTIARELVQRGADSVMILEKEPELGAHASGRNSGVLHAGLYYSPDSMKAQYCSEGNSLMKDYCRSNSLTLRETGKVIVAKDAIELERLDELKARADACGARARYIDAEELESLEPKAVTFKRALHSPDTAAIKPLEILHSLERGLLGSGKVKILRSTSFTGPLGRRQVSTSTGSFSYEFLINAAGAHADSIAHRFGVAHEYKILPFKGTYRKLPPSRSFLVRGSIYPVPDLRNPFLGVHFSRGADGSVYVGPTAIPAAGRESYRLWEGWSRETPQIIGREGVLLMSNAAFRDAALTEPRKYVKRVLFREARKLIPSLEMNDLGRTPKVGIRPQLVHWPTRQLVMDFVTHQDADALHVLNAVSPAFTCSMSFAKKIVTAITEGRELPDAVPISTA